MSSFRCWSLVVGHFRVFNLNFYRKFQCGTFHLVLVIFLKLFILGHGEMVLPVTNLPCRSITIISSLNFYLKTKTWLSFQTLDLTVPFLMKEETLKFIPTNPDRLTLLFVFILSNCTRSMILSISSGEGDKPRKEESFSISPPAFCGNTTVKTLTWQKWAWGNDTTGFWLKYLEQIFIEHEVDIGISLFFLPPVVHMVIPWSKNHWQEDLQWYYTGSIYTVNNV